MTPSPRTRLPRALVVVVSALALACSVLVIGAPEAHAGQLIGPIPRAGALGLVVWSGGNVEEITGALGNSGCTARSAWTNRRGGGLIGYLFGAPDAVNATFRGEYGGAVLPSNSPIVLVCAPVAAPAPAPTSPPAPAPTPPSATPTATPAATATAPAPAAGGLAAAEAEMLRLVNAERTANGLTPFVLDAALSDVARAHSADMVAKGYFAHNSLEGLSPFDRMARAGITYRTAAENIAWASTVQATHTALMNSPGHRANILNPTLGRIGIGIVQKDARYIMTTQNFRD